MIENYQEAIFLKVLVERAEKGDQESAALIEAENKIRQEKGEPTVQEELQQLYEKGVAMAAQRKKQQ